MALTGLEERKRKYNRARYNYYVKACKSLAAGIKFSEKNNLPTAKDVETLATFTAERDSHYAAWQELEERA